MKKRVLVVAGDTALRAAIAQILQPAGYAVELADGRKRACALIAAGKIDAAVIAPSSLGAQGQELAAELCRMIDRVIVLAESAREIGGHAASRSNVKGRLLQLVKQEQLLGRLSELLSPATDSTGNPPAVELVRFAERTVDLAGRTFHDETGREVPLTHAEFELLATLVRGPGRVLSRDYLRAAVAGRGIEADERSIDMLVARLRRKIEPDAKNPRFILTVPGEGYKFPLRPQRVEPSTAAPNSPAREQHEISLPRLERRQMTVLACLIGGLATRQDPEDLHATMSRVHWVIGEVVERFGGHFVAGSPGDRPLIQFGYRQAQEDDAERAVRAALELVRTMPSVDVGPPRRIHLRVGIATGVMLVDRTAVSQTDPAIGQPSNIAFELRSKAPPGAVVIGDNTRALLGSFFDYEELESLVLEEGLAPVRAWRVVGESGAAGRFDALHRSGMLALVDRDEQMELLLRRWQKAKAGNGQVVVLTGEPGIGKSRLVAELQMHLSAEPHACVEYFGLPYQTDASMFTVISELRAACGFTRADDASEKLRKLERMLHTTGADALETVTLVANLLGISVESQRLAELSPKERKARIFAILQARIDRLGALQPLLVIVEDIQWVDPTSLELLTILGERLSGLPVLMLATARPKFVLPWRGHPYVTIIDLPRLTPADAELLLERIAGKTLPKGMTNQILGPTEGVPLFVEELTKAVLETGVWQESEDIREPDVGHVQTIPNTLRGSLITRLDRLGAAKEIAQVGAVIGREFSYELLRAVTRVDEPELRSSLDRLGASELVFCRGVPPLATYMFKHALVCDAAYDMLVRAKKQELHGAVARALEKGSPETIEAQPELLAHHYREAGNLVKEANYLTAACERALSHSALREADRQISHAEKAISALPKDEIQWHLQLRLEMARARRVIEEKGYAHDDAGKAYREAFALSKRVGDDKRRLDALYGLWAHHFIRGEPVVMLSLAKEFQTSAANQNESGPIVMGHRLVGTSLLMNGIVGEATDALSEALRHYDPREHGAASPVGQALMRRFVQDLGVTVYSYLSWALWLGGKPDEAAHAARAAEQKGREAKESGHTLSLLYALWHAGMVYMLRRDRDEVERVGRELTALANGRPYWLALGDFLLGWHATHFGQPANAIEVLKRGLYERWEKTGSRIFRPICLAFLADAYAAGNEPALAKRCLEEALEVVKRSEERWAEPEILRLLGDLDARIDRASAIARYQQAIKVARDQGSQSFQLRATTSLARALLDQGKRAEAVDCLSMIYGTFKEGFDTPDLVDAKTVLERLQSTPRRLSH